jgi:hypothetical protein
MQYSLTDEETVARIADICPRAMPSYFLCLHNANPLGRCTFTRKQVINDCVRSWTKFKNDIRRLSQLFILTFLDRDDVIEIELIDQCGGI